MDRMIQHFCNELLLFTLMAESYRVSAPPEAKGDALDWVPHFSVRQLVDFNSETEIHDAFGRLALKAVKEELEARKHEPEKKRDLNDESPDRVFAQLAI